MIKSFGFFEKLADNIMFEFFKNKLSGSLIELISSPKQHEHMTSKVKLVKKLLIEIYTLN